MDLEDEEPMETDQVVDAVNEEPRNRWEERREVDQIVKHMVKASNTPRGYAIDSDLVALFKTERIGPRATHLAKRYRDQIIEMANQKMQKKYGLEIIRDDKSTQVRYYLRFLRDDQMSDQLRAEVKERNASKSPDECYKDAVLYYALMFIFMKKRHEIGNEQAIPRRAIVDFLESALKVDEAEFSQYFGPAKNAEFARQGYIRLVTHEQADGRPVECYDWGPRADLVVDKKVVLCKFCEIYGTKIYKWPKHAEVAGLDVASLKQMKERELVQKVRAMHEAQRPN